MAIKAGPVLGFRGQWQDEWRVSVLLVTGLRAAGHRPANGCAHAGFFASRRVGGLRDRYLAQDHARSQS